jgi:hypothetical protein
MAAAHALVSPVQQIILLLKTLKRPKTCNRAGTAAQVGWRQSSSWVNSCIVHYRAPGIQEARGYIRLRICHYIAPEGTLPISAYCSAAILSSFRSLAKLLHHRIDRSRRRHFPIQNPVAHFFIKILPPKFLELMMQVEYNRGMGKAPRCPVGLGVQTNGEESLPTKTQREMRASRIGTDAIVMALTMPNILVGERLQPFPQKTFKIDFAQGPGPPKNHYETLEQSFSDAIGAGEIEQGRIDTKIVPCRCDIARHDELELSASKRRFRP